MALTPDQIERYARHLTLREIGGSGQNALLAANVAIIGAGGLGGPAALYLAGAGIGHITLIDDDKIEASNLQRQIQFRPSDIGAPKASVMAERLEALNADCQVSVISERLTSENGETILTGHDVILDGTDNFKSRFTINAISRKLGIPLISGALGRFDLQISLFNASESSPCYRCFVSDLPADEENCATHGVLGAIGGMGGSMMAMEAIKCITGAGQPLDGRLYIFDALRAQGRTITLSRDPDCAVCGN
jgi:molybdopterin/thiamine biosynthesis adenylyltransferase